MTINRPIIDAGPTKPRGHLMVQSVTTHPAGPGETYLGRVNGVPTYVTVDPPTVAGQVMFHVQKLGLERDATMYVGVSIDGELSWAPIVTGQIISNATGRPFDSITDQ